MQDLEKFRKQMLEALTPEPQEVKERSELEQKRAEHDAAVKEHQQELNALKRMMTDRIYKCIICGNNTFYKTADELNSVQIGTATVSFPFVKMDRCRNYAFPMIRNGDVEIVGYPDPFIVCSTQCRKEWTKTYLHRSRIFKHWFKHEVEMPAGIMLVDSLDQLKNDTADEKGVTYTAKLEAIASRVDGEKGFYLYGTPGNGKTTIAAWLAAEYVAREMSVRFVGYTELQQVLDASPKAFDELYASILYQNVEVEEFTRKVHRGKKWDVAILDDVSNDFVPNSQEQRRMKNLFMALYENGTKLVITSNVDPTTLGDAISASITSRLIQRVIAIKLPSVDFRK